MGRIYHTSPENIEKIERFYGVFDSVLFFSSEVYVKTGADTVHVYTCDIEDSDVLDTWNLKIQYSDTREFKGKRNLLAAIYELDEDIAEDLLLNDINIYDIDDIDHAYAGWKVQQLQAELARELGYRFFKGRDEQGAYYAGDMFGREAEMKYLGLYDENFSENT